MALRLHTAKLLDRSGANRLVLTVRRAARVPILTVINYHRVNAPAALAGLDEGVLDATPQSLDEQLGIVAEHFTPIELAQLRAFLAEGKKLPPNPALVTFDDGYLDCYHLALPVLNRHGIKAVFFIATDYIANRRLFWWDKVHWILEHTERSTLELTYPTSRTIGCTKKEEACRAILSIIKTSYHLELDRFLRELALAAGVSWSTSRERQLADELLMTWDHVRLLHSAGMSIGAHTRTHRPLEIVPPDQLEDELAGARRDLEEQIPGGVDSIAYPVGRPVSHVPIIRAALVAAGYRMGFTYNTGAQFLYPAFDPLDLCRYGVERDMPSALFRSMLAVPFLAWKRQGNPVRYPGDSRAEQHQAGSAQVDSAKTKPGVVQAY